MDESDPKDFTARWLEKSRSGHNKTDEWAWLKVSLVIGLILALFIWFSNHYKSPPYNPCQNPNSQECFDYGADQQNCQVTAGEC